MISPLNSLGNLADNRTFTEPLALNGESPAVLTAHLKKMCEIRRVEEIIGDKVAAGLVKCPCHLAIGQEAVAVGVSAGLRKTDRVFGGHRSHSHFLAQGGSAYGLLAEIFGRESGCSKGMGGSMHLHDESVGFIGSVPIVAATVPLAVGAGLACQKEGKGNVAVSYFGDGSAEEGCVHEAMNFASVFQIPVLFVCENNFFSSHLHIDLRQPANSVSRYAAAHHIPYEVVDGNDVLAVQAAAGRLLTAMREGRGPGFLEAVTYRWRGHVGPSEDSDVGVKRSEDLVAWKQRDPIRRLADAMVARGDLDAAALADLKGGISAELEALCEKAERAPFPTLESNLTRVYAHTSGVPS